MNRLQVGDECYVRDITSGKIYKCLYGIDCDGTADERRAKPESAGWAFMLNDKDFRHRLVYPFPCVKELAI